jgi:hypothetical protein
VIADQVQVLVAGTASTDPGTPARSWLEVPWRQGTLAPLASPSPSDTRARHPRARAGGDAANYAVGLIGWPEAQ